MKVTWRMIFTDFKKHHPNLSKKVMWWRPHDYATIFVRLKDGTELLYDYDIHKAEITKRGD